MRKDFSGAEKRDEQAVVISVSLHNASSHFSSNVCLFDRELRVYTTSAGMHFLVNNNSLCDRVSFRDLKRMGVALGPATADTRRNGYKQQSKPSVRFLRGKQGDEISTPFEGENGSFSLFEGVAFPFETLSRVGATYWERKPTRKGPDATIFSFFFLFTIGLCE